MAEGAISIPPGTAAALRAGRPVPTVAPKADVKVVPPPEPKPKVELRKAAPPEPKPEPTPEPLPLAAEKKVWKLKDGDEEFEFDASDEEAVKREIMKGRAANKRFEQGAAMRKEAEQAFAMLKDPKTLREILKDPRVGIDVQKMAEEIVWEQIQEQQLTPEQKAQRDMQKKLDEYENRDKTAKQTEAQQRHQEAISKHEQAYAAKITKALETGAVPATEATVSRMAELLLVASEHGINDVTIDDLVSVVDKEAKANNSELLGKMDGEQLIAYLGEEILKRIRAADLKRLQNPTANPFPSRAPKPKAEPVQREARKPGKEWRDDLMKDFLNRKR